MDNFARTYLQETQEILAQIDCAAVEAVAEELAAVRTRGGRLFILGVGGSAGHASHAVNDFRKICGIESYTPSDNVSELTARINDHGWDNAYAQWLEGSRMEAKDAVLVLSVGGGSVEHGVSVNLVRCVELAGLKSTPVLGILGRDGGYTGKHAKAAVVIPPVHPSRVTPHTEGICAVVWHMLVCHPLLQLHGATWESKHQHRL